MGKPSRDKGASGERELARLLADELGTAVTRNLAQSRSGGHDLDGCGPFALEVKRAARATPALRTRWWAQAREQADRAGLLPALAYRQDRAGWRFVLPLSAVAPGAFGPWADDELVEVELSAFAAIVREGVGSPGA